VYCERTDPVTVTTAADQTAEEYSEVVRGPILAVLYDNTDFAAGADVTITTEKTGQTVATLTNIGATDRVIYPRAQVHGVDGVGLAYEVTNAKVVAEPVWAAEERLKIVVAQGGVTKTAAFTFLIGGAR